MMSEKNLSKKHFISFEKYSRYTSNLIHFNVTILGSVDTLLVNDKSRFYPSRPSKNIKYNNIPLLSLKMIGVKRGLRVTKAYSVKDHEDQKSSSTPTESGRDKQKLRVPQDTFDRRHTVGGALTTVQEEEDLEVKYLNYP